MNRIQGAIVIAGLLALTLFLSAGVSYRWTGHTASGEQREQVKYGSILDRRPSAVFDHGQLAMVDSWEDANNSQFDLWFGGIVAVTLVGVLVAKGKARV